jgi:3-dehydroquinate synthase II
MENPCRQTRERIISMREIWVKVEPWNKELVTTALEAGASAVMVPGERVPDVRALGMIRTIAEKGDLEPGRDVVFAEIRSAEDEERIVGLARDKQVVVKTTDWEIIPLENLVARTGNIYVEVNTLDQARVAAGILEKGVDGLLVSNPDPAEVREMITEMLSTGRPLELSPFVIEAIHPVGMGDRVCVDTCSLMGPGEGILVGNSSRTLFLVQAEVVENPYVSPRPFRVNAGAVHAYVMTPGGRTRYLSELRSGDEVLGVNFKGETVNLVVGRAKVERRPLLMMQAGGPAGSATLILQNAETIRLMQVTGEPVSVLALRPGDEILGHGEEGARHFGHRIREHIIEA